MSPSKNTREVVNPSVLEVASTNTSSAACLISLCTRFISGVTIVTISGMLSPAYTIGSSLLLLGCFVYTQKAFYPILQTYLADDLLCKAGWFLF